MKCKRILSVLLCLTLTFLATALPGYSAGADGSVTIYSGFSEAVAGDTVKIPIAIENNSGLLGFMLRFDYDEEALTPISVSYGDVCCGGLQDNIEGDALPGSFKVYWAGNENVTSDGVLFYINMAVNSAAVGNTEIAVSYSQADTFDEYFNDVPLVCQSIAFNIENNAYSQYAKIAASAGEVVAGELFQVRLNISEITNIQEVNMTLSYNADNFLFQSANSTATLTVLDSDGSISLNIKNISPAMNNTDFVTLTFKAKERAVSGTYVFELESEEEGVICKSCNAIIRPSATSEIAEIRIPQGVIIEKGETAQVPVAICNNHGIMGYRLTFDYNPDEIEIVSIEGCNDISGDTYNSIGNKPSSFDVLWNYTSEISADATLFYINIKNISNDLKQSTIGISYSQEDTFNEEYEDVVFDCQPGIITLCPGHRYTQQTVVPTCTEKGYATYVCQYCGDEYQSEYTDEIGHYYHYTGNQNAFEMAYVCEDCGEELLIGADAVYAMWNEDYLNIRPNKVDNRTKIDNSSLINVVSDSNVDDGIINAKDYALLLQLQQSGDNN